MKHPSSSRLVVILDIKDVVYSIKNRIKEFVTFDVSSKEAENILVEKYSHEWLALSNDITFALLQKILDERAEYSSNITKRYTEIITELLSNKPLTSLILVSRNDPVSINEFINEHLIYARHELEDQVRETLGCNGWDILNLIRKNNNAYIENIGDYRIWYYHEITEKQTREETETEQINKAIAKLPPIYVHF